MARRSHAFRPRRAAPAPTGRLVEALITELGGRGDGVAIADGQRLFVPHTLPGERALARIEGRRGDGFAATLVEVIQPAPEREAPICRHFGSCGGCALQHMPAGHYAHWKRGLLTTALARRGLGEAPVAPLVRVPLHSRRRAAFAFLRRRDAVVLGFNARASHRIIDLEECPLLRPALAGLLPALRRALAPVLPPSAAGDVVVTETDGGLDVLVAAPAPLDLFGREHLAAFAAEADLARLCWRAPGDVEPEPVARRRAPVVRFAGVTVEPPPGAFLQPSSEGERAIADLVVEAAGGAGRVADLYAGCGSFTFPLAAAGARVQAVEGDAALVAALKAAANAAAGRLAVTAETRDLARRPLLGDELKGLDAVVFDPPRAGAAEQAARLAEAGPPLVVAVSCNPATLARDARLLVDGGYRLTSVTPIDQFPFTPHLEAVAVLRR